MSITTGIGELFLEELPLSIHQMAEGSPSDTFRVALYGPNAALSPSTQNYITAGEVSGGGYTAGGDVLTNGLIVVGKIGSSRNGGLQFSNGAYIQPVDDITITVAGVAVRGCLLYNVTQSNRTIFTFDFGETLNPSVGITLAWGVAGVTEFSETIIPLLGLAT